MATYSASFQASAGCQVSESSQALHDDQGGVGKQQRLTGVRDSKRLDWTESNLRGAEGDLGSILDAVVHSIEPLAS